MELVYFPYTVCVHQQHVTA